MADNQKKPDIPQNKLLKNIGKQRSYEMFAPDLMQ
jgi:hypothetical protein